MSLANWEAAYEEMKGQRDQLLNALKWSVKHEGECLGDYPEILEEAKCLIAAAEGAEHA